MVGFTNLWFFKSLEVQDELKLVADIIQIKHGLIYKHVVSTWLPYVHLSVRKDASLKGDTQFGHGALQRPMYY